MNWEDARYFLAVARAGKINRAAENLGISPITLSRRMAHLQDQLKTTLLTRHNQGVELTQEGQRLFERIERAEVEIDLAADSFASQSTTIEGTLRIAAPEGFAIKILSPNLSLLVDQHPHLHVEIVPLPRGFSLSKREADIAIMVDKPDEPKLAIEKLTEYRLGLYASRKYVELYGTPTSVGALRDHRLIGYVDDLLPSERINTPRAAWNDWQSQIGIYSPLGQWEAVRTSAGVGVLHDYLVKNDPELVKIIPEISITREYWLVTHENIKNLPRIRLAHQFLREIGRAID